MNKKIITAVISALICANTAPAFAERECIALTNYSNVVVEFDSITGPGVGIFIQPNESATLGGDYLSIVSCYKNKCSVSVTNTDHSGFVIIHDLPLGTHIIYNDPEHYYLDKNAHVKCD